MTSQKGNLHPVALLALTVLAFGVLGCGRGDPEARIAALETELREARADATAEASGVDAPAEGAQEGMFVQEDFEGESSTFLVGEGVSLDNGALLLGPFEECANDVANFDAPVGCLVVCETCGPAISNYHLTVSFAFEGGVSEREFGVILRLADADGDGLLDREDYLLALGFNIFENRWRVYLHEPDKLDPWREVSSGQAGFLQSGRMNQLEVSVTDGGGLMEIRLNEQQLERLTGGQAEPGQRLVEPWIDAGAVGFIGLGRGVQVRFDDFVLEPTS